MAAQWRLFATFAVFFLTLNSAFSADPTNSSPAPAPEVPPADSKSTVKAPASSPQNSSPPAPPPSTNAPSSHSPSPAPENSLPHKSPSPSPSSPADSGDDSPSPAPSANVRAADSVDTDATEKKSSGGMNAAKKAGIAFGVLIGVFAVVVAGIIYKKRKDNIQRSQYGYATRSGLI